MLFTDDDAEQNQYSYVYLSNQGMNSLDRAENRQTVVTSERVTVSDTNFNP